MLHKESIDDEDISVLHLMRELGCAELIFGADYEVKDKKGELLYTVKKKSISINSLNYLLKYLHALEKKERQKKR